MTYRILIGINKKTTLKTNQPRVCFFFFNGKNMVEDLRVEMNRAYIFRKLTKSE